MQRTCLVLLSMAIVSLPPAGCGAIRHCTKQTVVSLNVPAGADCPSTARAQEVFDAYHRQAEGFTEEYTVIELAERGQIGPRKVCWYPGTGSKSPLCAKGSRASRLAAASGAEPQVSDLAQGPVTPCDDTPVIFSGSLPIEDSDEDCPAKALATNMDTAALARVPLLAVDVYPARTVCSYQAEYEATCGDLGRVPMMGGP